jgi:hypothetical protein
VSERPAPIYHAATRHFQDRFDTRRLADRTDERLMRATIGVEEHAFIERLDMFLLTTVEPRRLEHEMIVRCNRGEAARADSACERDRALRRADACDDALPGRPQRSRASGEGARGDRPALCGPTRGRTQARLLMTRLRSAWRVPRGSVGAESATRSSCCERYSGANHPRSTFAYSPVLADIEFALGPSRRGGVPLWVGSGGSRPWPGPGRLARSENDTTPERFAAAREALAPAQKDRGRDGNDFPYALATMWTRDNL